MDRQYKNILLLILKNKLMTILEFPSEGWKFRRLKVIDDYYWEGLVIRYRHRSSFINHEFVNWATENGIRIEYIKPSKPQQNAYIKRYN